MSNSATAKAPTKEQVLACIDVIRAIADCIKDCTEKSALKGIPSGELYANVMTHMSFEQYTAIINKLKELGIVRESNYLLTWIAPTK